MKLSWPVIMNSIALMTIVSCHEDSKPVMPPELPGIRLVGVSAITQTDAIFTAELTSLGNVECIQAMGFCLSTKPDDSICPDPANWYAVNLITSLCSLGDFNGGTGLLAPGTKYYLRAFAKNVAGTTITNEIEFTTSN